MERKNNKMEESYIRDYQINLLQNIYTDDLERLKAINYGLDYILESIQNNVETAEDTKKYNSLTTCYLTIKNIIDSEDERQTIPF